MAKMMLKTAIPMKIEKIAIVAYSTQSFSRLRESNVTPSKMHTGSVISALVIK